MIRTRLLLSDMADWSAVVEICKDFRRVARPVDTIMQAAGFANPEWLVEIEDDAVIAGAG